MSAGLGIALIGSLVLGTPTVQADEAPARVAPTNPSASARHPFAPRASTPSRRAEGLSGTSGGWWLGTAAMALALALCGGISVAARRYWPQAGTSPLRVVGRTSLSPKQSVHLVQVGERILIVGTGAQGPPSLLGELTDPDQLTRRASGPHDPSVALDPAPLGLDRPRGDDE